MCAVGTGRIGKQVVVERTEHECICAPLKKVDSTTKGGNEQHQGLITALKRRTAESYGSEGGIPLAELVV